MPCKRSGYKAAKASYNPESKTLSIERKMVEFVPGYVYYLCEYLENKNEIEIEYVCFTKENKIFKKEKLQRKTDWDDVK